MFSPSEVGRGNMTLNGRMRLKTNVDPFALNKSGSRGGFVDVLILAVLQYMYYFNLM